MRVRVVYGSRIVRWLFPRWVRGVTLYPFILLRERRAEVVADGERLLLHEWAHVQQIRRLGALRFYALYLWYSARHGYRDNPFEVEARRQVEEAMRE